MKAQPLNFASGENQTQVSDRLAPQQFKRYLVSASAGQVLKVEILAGDVTVDIRSANGELLEEGSGNLAWQAQLTESGDYLIDARASKETDFTLAVSLEN